jgi:hypothetical protein
LSGRDSSRRRDVFGLPIAAARGRGWIAAARGRGWIAAKENVFLADK